MGLESLSISQNIGDYKTKAIINRISKNQSS